MSEGDRRGNRNRCRTCGSLAGKDDWCKNHRPAKAQEAIDADKVADLFRDSAMDLTGHVIDRSGKEHPLGSEFEIIKDRFDIQRGDEDMELKDYVSPFAVKQEEALKNLKPHPLRRRRKPRVF